MKRLASSERVSRKESDLYGGGMSDRSRSESHTLKKEANEKLLKFDALERMKMAMEDVRGRKGSLLDLFVYSRKLSKSYFYEQLLPELFETPLSVFDSSFPYEYLEKQRSLKDPYGYRNENILSRDYGTERRDSGASPIIAPSSHPTKTSISIFEPPHALSSRPTQLEDAGRPTMQMQPRITEFEYPGSFGVAGEGMSSLNEMTQNARSLLLPPPPYFSGSSRESEFEFERREKEKKKKEKELKELYN